MSIWVEKMLNSEFASFINRVQEDLARKSSVK